MLQTWISVVFFVLVLALIPVGLKWVQSRSGVKGASSTAKIVSAVAVGPHQRVVTVEVGPEDARVWLTLGVTAQNISCLHSALAPQPADITVGQSVNTLPAESS